jgi:opacity protein-like surface antigen
MISAAAALTGALSFTGAFAADFRAPYMPSQNDDVPVELGSGWYIRGDLGVAAENALKFGSSPNLILPKNPNGWSAGVGGGYKFNNWFRADVTLDYRSAAKRDGYAGSIACQIGATPITAINPLTGTSTVVGSNPVYTQCNDTAHSRLNRTHVLANAYVDLGTWSGITPYVGAGVGANVIFNKSQSNWFMNNQNPYNVTWTDPFSNIGYQGYLDRAVSSTAVRLAWALMAGFAIDLTPHVKLDVGYRYLGLGSYASIDSYGNPVTKQMRAQEVRAGIRYTID